MSAGSALRERAKRLKTDVPALFLALRERDTPWYAKAVAALAVAYALSPVDLVPDFIPVLGYLDDLLILPALVALFARLVPPEVMARCRERAAGMWAGGKPKKWYYALPILLVWALVAVLIWKAVR